MRNVRHYSLNGGLFSIRSATERAQGEEVDAWYVLEQQDDLHHALFELLLLLLLASP